ncbi:AAA family ATPase [Cohnella yongneupensis]|uniref:AAA family ATPase n=1 Tax=Cohnella yongneupensis TaxID=425006 RepID=A0ABW0R555_9BACL
MLRVRESTRFVGRKHELRQMDRLLTEDMDEWRLLRLHGPSGIGKTALLKQFEALHAHDAIVLYADCSTHRTIESLYRDWSDGLAKFVGIPHFDISLIPDGVRLADRLNRTGRKDHSKVVLLLDAIEQGDAICRSLYEWLLTLECTIKVITAGQYPMESHLALTGWHRMIHHLRIGPLEYGEQLEILRHQSIHNRAQQEELAHWAGGFPLALSLAEELTSDQADNSLLYGTKRDILCGRLVERLLSRVEEPLVFKLIEISAMLHRFNEDTLTQLLNERLSTSEFLGFVRMPFIDHDEIGWSLMLAMKVWVQTDMRRRKPKTYEMIKSRVMELVKNETPAVIHEQIPDAAQADEAAYHAVNQILLNYAKMADHPDTVSRFAGAFPRLLGSHSSIRESILYVRSTIRRGIQAMSEQSDEHVKLGKLLEQAYLLGKRTHEKNAERLGYSMATYYRKLNKAKRSLTDTLARLHSLA